MKSVVFASDVASFISQWLLQPQRISGTMNLCSETAPTFNWIENAIAESGDHSFQFRVPIRILWTTVNWMRAKLNISIPICWKTILPADVFRSIGKRKVRLYFKTIKPNHIHK